MAEHFISRDDAERDLLAAAAYLAETIKSSDGRAQAMAAVVPRYLEKGEVDLAAELANTVDDPFVRDRLLIAVAETCASTDDDEYALQLVEAIEDPGMQAQARERIGLQLASHGKTEKARAVADAMEHRDNVLAGLAVKLQVDGAEEAAGATLSEIEYPAAAAHALVTMAADAVGKGEGPRAAEFLERSLQPAEDIEHPEERIRVLIDIGNSFAAAGRNDRAIETLDRARGHAEELDNFHRDNFLASVSLGLMRAGSIDAADRTLDAVQDKTQIATALSGFAGEYWKRDERDEALEALGEAYALIKSQHERETRDTKAKYNVWANIAVQFAGFGKGERALEIAAELVDDDYANNAFTQIARLMSVEKNDELMRQALASIRDDGHRVFTLIAMHDSASSAGDTAKATEFINEAFALAEEVPQLASRSAAYNSIATRYLAAGENDLARSAARESLAVITEIKDESSAAEALAGLSEVYEKGNFEIEEDERDSFRQLIVRATVG
jgi:tetratricopeptide (TPR) repeat protein